MIMMTIIIIIINFVLTCPQNTKFLWFIAPPPISISAEILYFSSFLCLEGLLKCIDLTEF
jgi:hypothetical protein